MHCWFVVSAVAALLAAASAPASGQSCTAMRKINVGVAVAPPNVVHTAPYVAKALGFFQKRCIDANIIQFDGGAAGTSVTAVGQGTALSNLPDTAIAQGLKARQVWGLAPRPPQAYVVPADVKTAADLKGRRLSAAGGVGGFNWLMGREVLRSAGLTVDDAQFGRGCEWRDHLCLRPNVGVARSNRCIAEGTAVYWLERDGAVI